MRAVVVGPGRVGRVLVAALGRAGHRVVGVAGGSADSRDAVRAEVAGLRDLGDDPAGAVAGDVDLVVLTVPDDVIAEVVDDLARRDAWREGQRVVHTSGARGLAPLRRAALCGCRVAACHRPDRADRCRARRAGRRGMGRDPGTDDVGWTSDLVRDLGGDPVLVADDVDRSTTPAWWSARTPSARRWPRSAVAAGRRDRRAGLVPGAARDGVRAGPPGTRRDRADRPGRARRRRDHPWSPGGPGPRRAPARRDLP